jgi:PAS domain S-box-containing protein
MLFLLLALLLAAGRPAAAATSRVLILSSYSPDHLWTAQEVEGQLAVLKAASPSLEICLEYMDWKLFPDPANLERLRELYHYKYAARKVDVILANDNAALEFALRHRDELFAGAPVVFCGINGYEQFARILPQNVTGVAEALDPGATLNTALRLHPATREVLVIVDRTESGLAARRELEQILPRFATRQVRFTFLDHLSLPEIGKLVMQLPDDRLVYQLFYNRDPDGTVYTHEESVERITGRSRVPVYHAYEFALGRGIVGGYLLSGRQQGETAARLALRVLAGESASFIPIVSKPACRPMFDNRLLERFGLSRSLLPSNAVILNQPDRFYQRHKAWIWAGGLALLLLLAFNVVLLLNIRRRQEAEAGMRESAQRFSAIADYTYDWESWFSPEGRLLWVNPAAERITGYNQAECLAMPDFPASIIHPEDRERIVDLFRRAARDQREGTDVEFRCQRKDGRVVWVAASWQPIYARDGHCLGLRSGIRDITDRRQAEEALRGSELLFRTLFEQAQVGICLADLEGRILNSNPAMQMMLGFSGAELFRLTLQEITGFGDAISLRDILLQASRDPGSGLTWESEYLRKDGRTVWCRVVACLLRDVDDQPLYVLGLVEDITVRKQAELERQRMERQIQQTQKLESLGVLAGGIAHDFNNLLTGVLGHASLALELLPPHSPIRENLSSIEKGARQAADLTRQLLAYSGKGRFLIETLDLAAVVRDMSHLFQISVSKRCTVKYELGDGLPPIDGDVSQVRQVIMNLVINASEAIGDREGTITVRAGVMECDDAYLAESTTLDDKLAPGVYVFLEVADSGCGMTPEVRTRMFDPFFTTKFAGRGLGLAAVIGIVRGHRGSIKVYSEVGRGSTFKALFPASAKAPIALRSIQESPEAHTWRGRGLVLVVDDEEFIRAFAGRVLRDAGFEVLIAPDGRSGLETFRRQPDRVRVVLLDLTMPGMDGEETFREMRRIRADVRVILSSGYNEQDAVNRFTGKGLAGFLQKPYSAAALRGAMRRTLEDMPVSSSGAPAEEPGRSQPGADS